MRPLANRLLLRAPLAPDRVGAIWLPPSVQQDYVVCQAEVVARGDSVRDWRLQPGARVVVKRFGRTALPNGDFVVTEESVLAIVDVAVL